MASGIPEDVMNLILQGPGAMQGALARTKGFGPTGKEAESATQLKRRFTDLELLIVKIGYDLLYKVTPHLEKFLDILQKIGAWAQRHEKVVAIIAGVAAGLLAIAGRAGAIGAVSLAWTALAGAFVAALPVLAVVGIVAALGAAILLLWQDYKVWSEGGKSFFDWTAWTGLIKDASGAWDDLSGAIENAWGWLVKWYDRAAKALGIDTSPEAQTKAEQASIDAYNAAHPNHQITPYNAADRKLATQIAAKEGFYDSRAGYVPNASGGGSHFSGDAKANIPQKAHNPGDIEYGDFAIAHGATGYMLAQGGKKIATFPDDNTGFMAMYALLGTKEYARLSPEQAIRRWQIGSALANGVSNASRVSSSVSSGASTSSTSTDNSKVTHIGTINMSNPAGSAAMTPSMVRGMDWNTLLTQQNFGLY
jgi:hypothetical protein